MLFYTVRLNCSVIMIIAKMSEKGIIGTQNLAVLKNYFFRDLTKASMRSSACVMCFIE